MKGKAADAKSNLKQQFVSAVTLSLLFGLGWGFGLPATSGVDNVVIRTIFQILFIILTAFQGLFIFIVYCLIGRKSIEARKEWKRWFYTLTCRRNQISVESRGTLPRSTGGSETKNRKFGNFGKDLTLSTGTGMTTLPRTVTSSTLQRVSTSSLSSSESFAFECTSSIASPLVAETHFDEFKTAESVDETSQGVPGITSKKLQIQEGKSNKTFGSKPSVHPRLQSVTEVNEEEEKNVFENPSTTQPDFEPKFSDRLQTHGHELKEVALEMSPKGEQKVNEDGSTCIANVTALNGLTMAEEGQLMGEKGEGNLSSLGDVTSDQRLGDTPEIIRNPFAGESQAGSATMMEDFSLLDLHELELLPLKSQSVLSQNEVPPLETETPSTSILHESHTLEVFIPSTEPGALPAPLNALSSRPFDVPLPLNEPLATPHLNNFVDTALTDNHPPSLPDTHDSGHTPTTSPTEEQGMVRETRLLIIISDNLELEKVD